MHNLLSVQRAGDRRIEQGHEFGHVGEVVDAGHGPFDGGRAVACGDPVGQCVKLDDELVVGDRVGGCAVRLVDADTMHVAVIGDDFQVRGEALGDVGVVTGLVEVDVGAFYETPDVVGVQSRGRELLRQHVAVE